MYGEPVTSVADPTAAPPPPHYFVPPPPGRFTRLVARAPRWLAPVAVLGCVAAAAGYVTIANPTESTADAPPTCLLKLTTGLDCPGCGGTRAFWYMINGDLPAAARHHALFIFVVPFLVYVYLAWAGKQIFGKTLPKLRVTPTMIGVFLSAWLAFSILRNLPWAPFTWFYV
ncbi:hypothetical protein Psuf_050310 [Phytohabitans suffuscus]|uniref:DUF2752 domain-containing protein n=1 Tax=Phytohabitans suffuscus TaxID=624315 RepID=A0A6F8YPA5_9ACTN|nr:hypothetical protein Psuf_050310 [Phytohabitans suffuscus]